MDYGAWLRKAHKSQPNGRVDWPHCRLDGQSSYLQDLWILATSGGQETSDASPGLAAACCLSGDKSFAPDWSSTLYPYGDNEEGGVPLRVWADEG